MFNFQFLFSVVFTNCLICTCTGLNRTKLLLTAILPLDYNFKLDLVRNYVAELVHYAMKMEPSETLIQSVDTNARITTVFKELMERQFPIETSNKRFKLRSPNDFASYMSVHVNHLNRALKKATGKTTTEHISERLTDGAKMLLKHTDWNISEIGYVLGFEDSANFNNFFKKSTNASPSAFRN